MCRLPLTELDGSLPGGRIIPAEQLTELFQQSSTVVDARGIVSAARRKAEGLIRGARKSCREMEADKRSELRALQRDTLRDWEKRWLKEHVTHLLLDEEQEQGLVSAVSGRIHYCIEQVLSAWFGQQSLDKTLCARLALQAEQMANEGILTLQCHPDLQECMREAFGSRFTLLTNSELSRDSAVLASSHLSVTFSLKEHFQQLLQWLHSTSPETGEQDEQGDSTGDDVTES